MDSEFGYKLTQKADADVDNIVSYIAMELANPKAASDFLDKLNDVIEEAERLAHDPNAKRYSDVDEALAELKR